MAIGLIGTKAGMTRIFTDSGESVPVTVIEVPSNRVAQVRTLERDGYQAVQVSVGERHPNRVNKPEAGHFAKLGVPAGSAVHEFRIGEDDGLETGAELKVEMFEAGQKVDVRGVTQGKGFQGAVKRHNFRTQDATHGNSLSHRAPGSIGQNQTPGRVFKGKRMAGHMGSVQRVAQNLEVVRIDPERNLILVKGAVPGSRGSQLVVTPAIKAKKQG
jgi:large subunit ribosomal protein L3